MAESRPSENATYASLKDAGSRTRFPAGGSGTAGERAGSDGAEERPNVASSTQEPWATASATAIMACSRASTTPASPSPKAKSARAR